MLRRHRQPLCGHKGCANPRRRGKIWCDACWAKLPAWLRTAIARARWARSAPEITRLTIIASDHLSGTRPAIDPATTRIAALCGDRIEEEAA